MEGEALVKNVDHPLGSLGMIIEEFEEGELVRNTQESLGRYRG